MPLNQHERRDAEAQGGIVGFAENEISGRIVQAAIEVHPALGGPGLLESVYEEALTWEHGRFGLTVTRHVPLPSTVDHRPSA